MGEKICVAFNSFNGHSFQKYRQFNKATGEKDASYFIDSVEVTQDGWIEAQEEALARDLARAQNSVQEPPFNFA